MLASELRLVAREKVKIDYIFYTIEVIGAISVKDKGNFIYCCLSYNNMSIFWSTASVNIFSVLRSEVCMYIFTIYYITTYLYVRIYTYSTVLGISQSLTMCICVSYIDLKPRAWASNLSLATENYYKTTNDWVLSCVRCPGQRVYYQPRGEPSK